MSDETTRIDAPTRKTRETASWAAIALALATGGGGIWTGNGVASRLETVAVTLAEIKGSIQRQDEGRLRLEARLDRLEERLHSLEVGRTK